MPTHPDRAVIDRDDPRALLGLLEGFSESVVVGFEPSRRHVDLHVAPLPPDARAGAAGLFGLRADDRWSAVGVAFGGRARHLGSGAVLGSGANAAVVVTRGGRMASFMQVEGLPDGSPLEDADRIDGGAEGLVVDALHRTLGLPSPGTPPSPVMLAATMWAHQILEVLLVEEDLDWERALDLHPGDPGTGPVGPSDEMVLEATVRATEGFRWSDMHRRAASGGTMVHELTTREAAWMDTTMFARWVIGALPDPSAVIGMLRLHDCHVVAERLQRLVVAIGRLRHGEDPSESPIPRE